METPPPQSFDPGAEEMWQALLLGTFVPYRRNRKLFKHIPSEPRCKMCAAPFGRPGSVAMGWLGRKRWSKNPKYCRLCFDALQQNHGGAEIDCSLLFADVRGSTTMAEGMSSLAFRNLMDRFFALAAPILVDHDALVDKFVGDEVIGIFIPALTGDAHAARSIKAARALLAATGHGRGRTPWLPIGIGINTGTAFVGAVGEGSHTELTAMGDAVNTAARLSSLAASGEVLVTLSTAAAAGLATTSAERRDLALKGKALSTEVLVLHA